MFRRTKKRRLREGKKGDAIKLRDDSINSINEVKLFDFGRFLISKLFLCALFQDAKSVCLSKLKTGYKEIANDDKWKERKQRDKTEKRDGKILEIYLIKKENSSKVRKNY